MEYQEIQERLKTALNAQGWGFQARLCKQLERKQAEVSQWYTGRRPIPAEMLERVANALDLELTLNPRKP